MHRSRYSEQSNAKASGVPAGRTRAVARIQ
jgi:hypothetical protein